MHSLQSRLTSEREMTRSPPLLGLCCCQCELDGLSANLECSCRQQEEAKRVASLKRLRADVVVAVGTLSTAQATLLQLQSQNRDAGGFVGLLALFWWFSLECFVD